MQKQITIQVSPEDAVNEIALRRLLQSETGANAQADLRFRILKRSIDARSRRIKINLTLIVAVDEPLPETNIHFEYPDVSRSEKTCHIIGAGPAGLFAALQCVQLGIKPIIIERGKDVKARRRDLAAINRDHIVNPESNYCFGEGGAGTYSDGKLYTRSSKRGDIDRILRILVFHGANDEILVDAHPHIGTNKLPLLIENIRETLLKSGAEVRFNTKLTEFNVKDRSITDITLVSGENEHEEKIQNVILATGHSARDIYEMVNAKGITMEAKPFALGVRVEHPQVLVDQIQYHCRSAAEAESARQYLPAASYSLVHQVGGRGVYSFCMCPGGIIAPCATSQQEIVTNGWSPSKRNNPYANSGIVVGLETADFMQFRQRGALAGLEFQKKAERSAWIAGGKTQTAPAQRLGDFVAGRTSSSLPVCSYKPGVASADLYEVLGPLVGSALREGFKAFGKKMRGYLTNEAVILGVESRTSTPVRIPRDNEMLSHPQIRNLYPCGEGAGYAGGIMSAAMDGERCAKSLQF